MTIDKICFGLGLLAHDAPVERSFETGSLRFVYRVTAGQRIGSVRISVRLLGAFLLLVLVSMFGQCPFQVTVGITGI